MQWQRIDTQEFINSRNMFIKIDIYRSEVDGSYKTVQHLRNSTSDRYFDSITEVNKYIASLRN